MKKFSILIFGLMIVMTGLFMGACTNPYVNVRLLPSVKYVEVEVGKTSTFEVSIENYNINMSQDILINDDSKCFESTVSYLDGGRAVVEILGLKVGEENLNISTREGSKTCFVNIVVVEPVQSFKLKTNPVNNAEIIPYVIKEEGFVLNFNEISYFDFNPSNASKTKVSYFYNNGGVEEKVLEAKTVKVGQNINVALITADNTHQINESSFDLTAKLDYYPNIQGIDISVDIIEPINLGKVNVIKKGFNNNYFSPTEIIELNADEEFVLISSDINNSYVVLELQVYIPGVMINVSAPKSEIEPLIPSTEEYTKTSNYSYFFSLQSRQLGKDTLTITTYYENYEGYEIKLEFKLNSVSAPSSIHINGEQEFDQPIYLYDVYYGNDVSYDMILEVYSLDSVFDSISFSFVTDGDIELSEPWSDYVEVRYKGQLKTNNFIIENSDFFNNTLISPISLRGLIQFEGNLFIKLSLNSSLTGQEEIVNYVPIIIEEGATKFTVSSEYPNGLSLDISQGAQIFDQLVVESSTAYIGLMSFEYISGSDLYFSVEQVQENQKDIKITPLSIGQGTIKIILPNGRFVSVPIKIEQSLISSKLSVVNNDHISLVETDVNENISKLAIKYTPASLTNPLPVNINLKHIINPAKATLYKVEFQIYGQGVSFDKNNFILSVNGIGNSRLEIMVILQEVENFELIDVGNTIFFAVDLDVYYPLQTFNYQQDGYEKNAVSVYKSSDVGYYYAEQGYANVEIDLLAELFDKTKINDVFMFYEQDIRWTTELGTPEQTSTSTGTGVYIAEGKINNFGQYKINKNHLEFICDDPYAQAGTTFWLAFTITEFNTSKTIILNISILNYTPLHSVGFYNYADEIYLSDAVPSYAFNTFIGPESDCKEFDVIFEPADGTTSENLISASINSDFTEVIINYNLTGTGYGKIYFIPLTSYINKTEYTTYISIDVRVSDGTDKNNPLIINTAEEFITIMSNSSSLNKHYKIATTLNFENLTIPNFGEFKGSIIGANQSARLTNIKLNSFFTEVNNSYVGLFTKLAESAELKNLRIEGQINLFLTTPNNFYAGLIAGENYGRIENVSVVLGTSKISVYDKTNIDSYAMVNIGGVVGNNHGIILNVIDNLNNANNHTTINQTGLFEVRYEGYSRNVFVGGVVGENNAVITRQEIADNYVYNMSIFGAIVNIKTIGISATGGIAGVNKSASINIDSFENSTVSNLLVKGKIEALRYNINSEVVVGGEFVGGIIGDNWSYVENCTSRVFTHAYNFVGGIAGHDSSVMSYSPTDNASDYAFINNCLVQAVYENSFAYMLTALSNEGNVGAISGNETSVLNQRVYEVNGNHAFYYYNIDTVNNIYPMAYFHTTSYTQIKFDELDEYFSLFRNDEAILKVESITSDYDLGAGKLQNSEYDNLISYMFYYQSKNLNEQNYIDEMNTDRSCPFIFENSNSIMLRTLNKNILDIDTYGNIRLFSTGIAMIEVRSLLNTASAKMYVYIVVTNAFDGFEIKGDGLNIVSGSTITVYENIPVDLSYEFNHEKIETRNQYQQLIWVEVKKNVQASLNVVINESNEYVKVLTVGNILTLKVNNLSDSSSTNTISFYPQFSVNINEVVGLCFMQSDDVFDEFDNLITRTDKQINIIALAKRGTEKINVDISETTAEPLDVLAININQITDFENDYLIITSSKAGVENDNNDYFIVQSCQGYDYSEIDGHYSYKGTGGIFNLQFDYEKYILLSDDDYTGVYYINFTADNGKTQTIIVHMEKQQVTDILTKNFYNVSTTFDDSQIEEDYVAPGTTSLLCLEIYPYFSEYDYIKVENSYNAGGNALVFEVVKLGASNELETVYVPTSELGVEIPISIIKENTVGLTFARIFVKYTTTSTAIAETNAQIVISAIKLGQDNEEILQKQQMRTIKVIIKDTVAFSIVGKTTSQGKYYVAKGLSYELDLNIYGFSEEQMVANISSNYATITKTDGTYYLNIASSINYLTGKEGFEITITTYGENSIDGFYYQSNKSYLNLVVVDYVIKTENINPLDCSAPENIAEYQGNTIIKNAGSGTMRISLGNTIKLQTELINGVTVEYDSTNPSIVASVQEFAKSLTHNGSWDIVANQLRVVGDYITKIRLAPNVEIANEYLRVQPVTDNMGNTQYEVSPLRINIPSIPTYYFTYTGGFHYINGVAVFDSSVGTGLNLSTHFVFDVYSTGNESNAIPIYDYTDLINMNENSWYILMNDLTLPGNFNPLLTNVAGFNGNGYNINFPVVWNVADINNVGLFGTLQSQSILKNITIKISSNTKIIINNESAVNFGFIAGQNLGAITNCAVISENLVSAEIFIQGQGTSAEGNYVAGLVGNNKGYITNSRIEMVLVGSANVAGFVGVNEKYISSSYVLNSNIINKSDNASNHTAGFVVRNGIGSTTDAHISTSYVSGAYSINSIYSKGTEKVISSHTQVAGFVYDNYSKISDCYSNIPINSSSFRAGFVFNNAGHIKNTYSTSTFALGGESAYGFLVNNAIEPNLGTVENSIYLLGTVNSSVNKTIINGVSYLSEIEFSYHTHFKSFVISSSSHKTSGVWFYPSKTSEVEFVRDGEYQQFIFGKLELVAPNIIVDSQKMLDANNITIDAITNETTYAYFEAKETEGSLFNPYTITTANDLENLMLLSSNKNINTSYFRITSFLDYEAEKIYSSRIYKTIFKGDIEGNNMTISGFVIDTRETLVNGGLFAKIGSGTSGEGFVKNLNLKPKYINMPNTSYVGTLAGSLESGELYNVTVDGFGYSVTEGLVIMGHYCVGGVIGVASNNFTIKNVSSSMSASASYNSATSNKVGIYTTNNTTKISYAGAILGVANNMGNISYVSINNNIASMAEIGGLVFGKIGANVNAEIIDIELNEYQFVRATKYGGVIAGENCGNISNVNISGVTMYDFFKVSPILPIAVGGAVGLMYTGQLNNINCSVNFKWQSASPTIVGGIVGEMLGGNINNTVFGGVISANHNAGYVPTTGAIVGGIVGRISYQPFVALSSTLTASNATLYNCRTLDTCDISVTTDSVYRIYVGGLVGQAISTYRTYKDNNGNNFTETSNIIKLNRCTNLSEIRINSIIFDGTMQTCVGGLIGGVFAGANESYPGEVIIYDELTEQTSLDLYASYSISQVYVNIKDMKVNGIVSLKYGGIFGCGYPVKESTIISGVPDKKISFGQMLEVADKELTVPYYLGQYELDKDGNLVLDEYGNPIIVERWQESGYLTLILNLGDESNAIKQQNPYSYR
ncbi:MAG: hypothetical protein PHI76_02755 [Clostridia bacterium]|nr:hypothetical protein [Clostridia bacterium]